MKEVYTQLDVEVICFKPQDLITTRQLGGANNGQTEGYSTSGQSTGGLFGNSFF